MKTTRRILFTLSLTMAFCFALTSLVQAGANDLVTEGWAKNNLVNKKKAAKIPIWQITQEGTAKSIDWVEHAPNKRFAIYDAGTPEDEADDIVLDKETGLVWERTPDTKTSAWKHISQGHCLCLQKANRQGFRLPTIEELASLIDYNNLPALPTGHPFNVIPDRLYWSKTSVSDGGDIAWYVNFSDAHNRFVYGLFKDDLDQASGWCVRGGQGHDGY